MTERDEAIGSWCDSQLDHWAGRNVDAGDALGYLRYLSAEYNSFFLYRFSRGRVTIADKPEITGAELASRPLDSTANFFHRRAKHYYLFLAHVARHYLPDAEGPLGLFVRDLCPPAGNEFPYFCFQKMPEERQLLLPDIDFLARRPRYAARELIDPVPYESKEIRAVFAGSTTGGRHSVQSIARLDNPRLRAAVRFRGNPDVEFRLPKIVQCTSPEAEARLREMGFGDGRELSWQEQFRRRFMIAMDGNGASCSRLVIALKSHCVPLKYDSPHALFYFPSLRPGVHYVPIGKDEDVLDVVADERRRPGLYKPLAEAGVSFYRDHLTYEPVVRYTATLIKRYFELLRRGTLHPPAAASGPSIVPRVRGNRCAVFTISKNEPVFLPMWLRYYARSFEPRDIYVLDHESTDGTTSSLDCNVERISSDGEAFNHAWLRDKVSEFQQRLLGRYEYVLFAETDEFIHVDPSLHGSLPEFLGKVRDDVYCTNGYDVVHRKDVEAPLDLARPLLAQRRFWRRSENYSKPLLARVPCSWGKGFHRLLDRAVAPTPGLYLLHLHKIDFSLALEKCRRNAALRWSTVDLERGLGKQNRLTDPAELWEYFLGKDNPADGPIEPIPEAIRGVL